MEPITTFISSSTNEIQQSIKTLSKECDKQIEYLQQTSSPIDPTIKPFVETIRQTTDISLLKKLVIECDEKLKQFMEEREKRENDFYNHCYIDNLKNSADFDEKYLNLLDTIIFTKAEYYHKKSTNLDYMNIDFSMNGVSYVLRSVRYGGDIFTLKINSICFDLSKKMKLYAKHGHEHDLLKKYAEQAGLTYVEYVEFVEKIYSLMIDYGCLQLDYRVIGYLDDV